MLPAGLERVCNPLHTAGAHGDHVESICEPGQLGMCCQVRARRPLEPALLLGAHHLQRIAEALPALALDLHEHDPPAAPGYEVELVPSRPDVRAQDAVAAQPVVPARTELGQPSVTLGRDSRAPGRSAGGWDTDPARARPPNARA